MLLRTPYHLLLLLFPCFIQGQDLVRGVVVEGDSATPMPFVFIINKGTGNGTVSDNDGRFVLKGLPQDTFICSYVGYIRRELPVSKLQRGGDGTVRIVMIELPLALSTVTVSAFRIKPYERQYMTDIIDRSRIAPRTYANAPITALYSRFSREGRQVRKLAQIFEDLLIEEEVQKKLSRDILTRLTQDPDLDYAAFRKYCYQVSDYFIVTHEGAELYSKVMECYRRWKSEGR